jgi:hypothetical protein
MITINNKQSNRLKIISFFLMIGTLIFFVFIAKKQSKEDCINLKEQYRNVEYKGVIDKKFKDRKNHSAKTIIIEENEKNKVFRRYRDISGLYEYARVGDSIYKPKGSLKAKVIRGEKSIVFTIDLNCDDI